MAAIESPRPSSLATIASPCVGVCKIDDASGLCLGCARTAEEIAVWRQVAPERRQAIWDKLPDRRAALGITLHRLGWLADDIRTFAAQGLGAGRGTWALGVYGAVGEFSVAPGEPLRVESRRSALEAVTGRGALRLAIDDSTRALGLAHGGGSQALRAVVLAVTRVRLALPVHAAVTALGLDGAAVRDEDKASQMFDLGLGTPAAQFCIRSADPALLEILHRVAGAPWMQVMAVLGPAAMAHAPHRVVCTAMGRVEVFAPIPGPGDRSPEGPHTHLLPDCLAQGRETSPDMDLPDVYAPGAVFYPPAAGSPADVGAPAIP